MKNTTLFNRLITAAALTGLFSAGTPASAAEPEVRESRYIWPADYMAGPAAHLFDGKIWVYTSHDWDSPVKNADDGAHYDMKDYHAFSIDGDPMTGTGTDHGAILSIDDVPWVARQMWATDVAEKDGKYYLYFSAKDYNGLFRIGVAVADTPAGPFKAAPDPIRGTYSIDPAVFHDGGEYYLVFGGLLGGQNHRYDRDNILLETVTRPVKGDTAIPPRIARLSDDMTQLAEQPRPIIITDSLGNELTEGDPHRYFEAPWIHKYGDKYYLTFSTGGTHFICYAVADSPYGPYVCKGEILTPVTGWTTHQSTVEKDGQWYLFFHDSAPSGGVSALRSTKVMPLTHRPDGSIVRMDGGKKKK
ncbi:MAG: family 43 glycosylhydrolase [Duncaniella sp.]|nr:family 43 glycosylhydrolase [Duncaniella sp.]